jgi:CheY-like chemotaxis protein
VRAGQDRRCPAAATATMNLLAEPGYGELSDRQRSRQAGLDHHLVRPVDLQELQRLVAD